MSNPLSRVTGLPSAPCSLSSFRGLAVHGPPAEAFNQLRSFFLGWDDGHDAKERLPVVVKRTQVGG